MLGKPDSWFVDLFGDIETGLRIYCGVDEDTYKDNMERYYENPGPGFQSDEQVFQIIVKAIFFAGVKAEQIENHMSIIKQELFDFRRVALYSKIEKEEIKKAKKEGGRVGYWQKSEAAFAAADTMLKIIDKFGSFAGYLEKEHDIKNLIPGQNAIRSLLLDLEVRFDRVRLTTACHITTMIGFRTIKPDEVIRRLFSRLGLIGQRAKEWDIVSIGLRIIDATGYSAQRIDNVLVKYGAMGESKLFGFRITDGICRENIPKCEQCMVRDRCGYFLSGKPSD